MLRFVFRLNVFLLLIISSAIFSCKATRVISDLDTLTADEQKLCTFSGKRFMLMFSNDFIEDANVVQDIFGRSSSTYFIDDQYAMNQNSIKNLEDCLDRLRHLGKYELYVDKRQEGSTWATFVEKMRFLKSDIKRYRREKPKQEIQIMLFISSHGDKDSGLGTIVFADRQVPYQEFLDVVYGSLITQCSSSDCKNVRRDTTILASELILMVDNCFSGNLTSTMRSYFESKIGYSQEFKIDSVKTNKTRILALASSAINQTAVGSVTRSSNVGTLTFALKQILPPVWLGDFNRDSRISLKELDTFVKRDLPGALVVGSVDGARTLAADLICGDFEARNKKYRELRNDEKTFSDYFSQSKRYTEAYDVPGKIQMPDSYSNMTDSLMGKMVLAVTNSKNGNRHIPEASRIYYEKMKSDLESAKKRVPAFIELAKNAFKLLEEKPGLLSKIESSNEARKSDFTPSPVDSEVTATEPSAQNLTPATPQVPNTKPQTQKTNSAFPGQDIGENTHNGNSEIGTVKAKKLTEKMLGISGDSRLKSYYAEVCSTLN